MEFKTLFDGTKLPAIGFGTWKLGGERESDYSKDEQEINVVKKAIEIGYTFIDTAELYGAGHCEELIGKAIKNTPREKLFIVSKVFKTNLKYDSVINACKKSLERLDIDYLDLYLIHAPSEEVPLEETMRAMDYLVEQGLVKRIGVSNFPLDLLKEAQKYSKNKICVNQIQYSLFTRNQGSSFKTVTNMEKEIIPYCQENNIIVIAYRPIERGLVLKNELIKELAKKYDKSPTQIALNWLISKRNVIPIPMSRNELHQKENLESVDIKMSEEDYLALDNLKSEYIDNIPKK